MVRTSASNHKYTVWDLKPLHAKCRAAVGWTAADHLLRCFDAHQRLHARRSFSEVWPISSHMTRKINCVMSEFRIQRNCEMKPTDAKQRNESKNLHVRHKDSKYYVPSNHVLTANNLSPDLIDIVQWIAEFVNVFPHRYNVLFRQYL